MEIKKEITISQRHPDNSAPTSFEISFGPQDPRVLWSHFLL